MEIRKSVLLIEKYKQEYYKDKYLKKQEKETIKLYGSTVSFIFFSRKLPIMYFFNQKDDKIIVRMLRKCMVEKEVNGCIERVYTDRFILRKNIPVTVYNTARMRDNKIKFIWG